MTKIKLLSVDLVNKIAAGEVIERPASVVKELVENSIDSGADMITVDVEDGGKCMIKVTDNGSGIEPDDLSAAFQPHATSKLSGEEGLFLIQTLGFRGEALASIASVSKLLCKTSSGGTGWQIELEGGKELSTKKAGHPKGTTIVVKELFYNTPARKKHMRRSDAELSHISNSISRFALANPGVGFKLASDARVILNIPSAYDTLSRMMEVYGKDIARNMISVEYNDSFAKVDGYIGKPYAARTSREYQTLIINGRIVRSDTISKALYDAYHTMLFLDRHPVAVLFLTIDLSRVDVNVHPTKDIIRVSDEKALYDSVFSAVRSAFEKNSMIPEVAVDAATAVEQKGKYGITRETQTMLLEKGNGQKVENPQRQFTADSKTDNDAPAEGGALGRIGPTAVIGQLNRLYIVAEGVDGLLIVDQHAAQERVLFEALLFQHENKKVERQKLLSAIHIDLGQADADFLEKNIRSFNAMGFDIDLSGKGSFAVRQVPKLLQNMDKKAVISMISECTRAKENIGAITEESVARMACRKAVKSGAFLTLPQMQKLIDDLGQAKHPMSCPHGRPTIIKFGFRDIEKKFRRVV